MQIQPTDAQYSDRVWTKQEYDQLQAILQQLYPYCVKLNQVRQTMRMTNASRSSLLCTWSYKVN